MSYQEEVINYLRSGKYKLEIRCPVEITRTYHRKYVLIDKLTGKEDVKLWYPFSQHDHQEFIKRPSSLEFLVQDKEIK